MSASFADRVLGWFAEHGRTDLPWQHPRTRYRVWVSEIMLQQTQVATVRGYFERFIDRFPDVRALADAPLDDVLALWSGLGYYARARNLHRAAIAVRDDHGGDVPDAFDALLALPGIGRSTAGAILAQADGARHAILDGNVKRVLARHEAIGGWPGKTAVTNALWTAAERYTPATSVADYTQAIMDLGATVCTRSRPLCVVCPVADSCQAFAAGTTDAFPGKRPRKPRPVRAVNMLVWRREDGAVLLERRPDHGVWGGLWSFPERDAEVTVPAEYPRAERLPGLTHRFTHFDLEISPWCVPAGSEVADAPSQRWVHPDALESVGVPRPVEQILESLQSARSLWEYET